MKRNLYLTYFLVYLFSSISSADTFLYFDSEQGDYIGRGIEQSWSTEDGIFTAFGNSDSNSVRINFNGGSDSWNLNFSVPVGGQLQTGSYENATRYPFHSPTGNGLSVSGSGRGCNTLTGRFDILEISYIDGVIDSLSADFEQHCEGLEPALFGSIRYNSSIGFPVAINILANGSHTAITTEVGQVIDITVSTEAGDDLGIDAEYWLGRSGSYRNKWFNGEQWVKTRNSPKVWKVQPIDSESLTFQWTPTKPGVYMYQFIVDTQLQTKHKLNPSYADHIVIIVK